MNELGRQDIFMKLMQLQSRLGNCEIIKPGRCIIKEGELQKVSRKTLQPRYLILVSSSPNGTLHQLVTPLFRSSTTVCCTRVT